MQMPDTTTPRQSLWNSPGIRFFYAMLFCTSMLLLSSPALFAQGSDDSAGQACPGATEVLNVSDRTNLDTEPFTINSEAWQVVVSTTTTSEDPLFSFTSVSVIDDNFSSVATQDFDANQGGVIDVTGAGTYTLTINSEEQSYDISVVECGGNGAPSPDPGPGPQPDPPEQDTSKGNVQTAQGPEIQQTPQTGGVALLPAAGALLLVGSVAGGLFSMRRR